MSTGGGDLTDAWREIDWAGLRGRVTVGGREVNFDDDGVAASDHLTTAGRWNLPADSC